MDDCGRSSTQNNGNDISDVMTHSDIKISKMADENTPEFDTVDKRKVSRNSKKEKKNTISAKRKRPSKKVITKELRIVLDPLDVTKAINVINMNKAPVTEQAKMTNYLNRQNVSGDSYFTVHESSTPAFMVKIGGVPTANVPSPDCANIKFEEEDLDATIEFIAPNGDVKLEVDQPMTNGSGLSTEVQPGPSLTERIQPAPSLTDRSFTDEPMDLQPIEKPVLNKRGVCKRKTNTDINSNEKPVKKKAICPSYKIVSGTRLAVDAFRYGNIDGVENYFLTHFHADHYIGMTKKFCHKLYASEITGW